MKYPWPVVDTHCHVISLDTTRYPLAPVGGKPSPWSIERPVDDAGMLAAMSQAGVTQAVLVQASTCYGHDNRYMVDCVKAHQAKFAGVYSVDLMSPDAAQAIGHWDDAGLEGVRFFVAGHSTADRSIRLDDPRAQATWQFASDNDIPVCVQIRADGLPQLEAVLTAFPRVRILLDHFARPALDDGAPYRQADSLWALSRFTSLNFKLTTHNLLDSAEGRSTPQAFCQAAVEAFGAHRIAWGSNFPAAHGTLAELLDMAVRATAGLREEDRAMIFSGTARRLYPGLGDGAQ